MERNYKILDELGRRAELILYQHMSAPEVAHVLGISTTSVWRHAAEAGFRKRGDEGDGVTETPETEVASDPLSGDPLVIAMAALARAEQALMAGKSVDAQSHIKAGLAVGDFAEVVMEMRAARAVTYPRESAGIG